MLMKEFDLEEYLHVREEEREEGREEGREEERKRLAKSLLDVLDIETISKKTGLSKEEIKKLKEM